MKNRHMMPALLSLGLLAFACGPAEQAEEYEPEEPAVQAAEAGGAVAVTQMYPNAPAPTVLETDMAVVQTLALEPGVWAGEHGHAGNQVTVILTAGTLSYRQNGVETDSVFEAGDVRWIGEIESHDHAAKDTQGTAVLVTLKNTGGGMAAAQTYPELEAGVVLENEHVIVQRITGMANDWTGEHSHPGGQISVVLSGGTMTYREGGEETQVTYEDGAVFTVEATDAHDHMADMAIDAIIITPKK